MAKALLALERFLPYRLSVATNRISGALSRHYADRFGIGIPEWRVIAILGRYAGLNANAVAERSAMDTNWYLGDTAPAWQEDSEQWRWLLQTLAEAQKSKAFTFVMFHPAPYSSGIHGRPTGVGDGENFSSGLPLRALTPLLLRFGVDAVFTGHDEIYEHSAVPGQESGIDGSETEHTVHFYTVGIGGDGLRGLEPDVSNPYSLFAADRDAPEIVDDAGILRDGGKHYGHVLVDVSRADDGSWRPPSIFRWSCRRSSRGLCY